MKSFLKFNTKYDNMYYQDTYEFIANTLGLLQLTLSMEYIYLQKLSFSRKRDKTSE